jgi:autotransporter-associated beta strand protein
VGQEKGDQSMRFFSYGLSIGLTLAFLGAALAGTQNNFFTDTVMQGIPANYSAGTPTNASDVLITTASGTALTISGGSVAMESLSVTNGTSYTITNATSTAMSRTLTVGNGAGFTNSVSGNANDLFYLASNSNLTISATNTGGGAGVLNLALANTGSFNISTGSTLTVTSAITGSGIGFNKMGGGTIIFGGTNAYSGVTTISSGAIQIGNGGTNGTLGTGNTTDNAALVFNRSDSSTYAGAISGSGTVAIQSGTLVLTVSSGYTGQTTISSGATLQLGNGGGGGILTGTTSIVNNGTIVWNHGSGSAVTSNATNISGTGGLIKQGTVSWQLNGGNTYSGSTLVSTGLLSANATTSFSPNSDYSVDTLGSLGLRGNNNTIKSLSGVGTVLNYATTAGATPATLTVGGDSTNTTFAGTVQNGFTGAAALSVAKSGTGSLTLSGNSNTYSGGTTVIGGTLRINNTSGSGTGSGAVTVNGSSAVLGGTGSVDGSISVLGGGTLAPGSGSAVGTFTVNTTSSSVTIGSTSSPTSAGSKGTLSVHVDGTSLTNADKAAIAGASGFINFVTTSDNSSAVDSDVYMDFSFLSSNPFSLFTTYHYTIGTTTNGDIRVNNATVSDGATLPVNVRSNYAAIFPGAFDAHPADFTLLRNGNNLQLDVTPVPEPMGVTAIFAAGLGGAVWLRRRQRSLAAAA